MIARMKNSHTSSVACSTDSDGGIASMMKVMRATPVTP